MDTRQQITHAFCVSRISYTRLDELIKVQSAFFSSDRSEVSFYFIELRNLDTGEALRGVEVAISSTFCFCSMGRSTWLWIFLNGVLGELGREQEQFKINWVALQDRFELGMMYGPEYRPAS